MLLLCEIAFFSPMSLTLECHMAKSGFRASLLVFLVGVVLFFDAGR